MVRLLSYNIHSGKGVNGRRDLGLIAAVIAEENPDIVALQEVDVGRARSGKVDQAREIAEKLGMLVRFHPAFTVETEQYGEAILTALPTRVVKAGALPGHRTLTSLEVRGALWVAVETRAGELNLINTHLGLVPSEQRAQALELAGENWLGQVPVGEAAILVGDLNATSRHAAYRTLTAKLVDAHRAAPGRGRIATFPSPAPVLRIDHILVNPAVRVLGVHVPDSPAAQRASDHRPLVADFEILGRAPRRGRAGHAA